jgi:glycosyltransferase involved in cell wall biosynthesis
VTGAPDNRATHRGRPDFVTVVIPVRDGAGTIGEQLAALGRQTYTGEWEVVVADNGSTDATVTTCEGLAHLVPLLRVVDASDRPGSSHARNVGAEHAKGDLLAFCDADDVVDDRWLDELVLVAADHDLVGGVQQESMLNDASTLTTRSARARKLVTAMGFLPFAPTSNLAMWADVYADLGGLNEEYPQAHDVELSWRAQLASYRLGFAPDAVVHYRYRTTLKGMAKQGYLSGIDIVRLYRDFRTKGLQVDPPSKRAKRWARMLAGAPLALVSPRRRAPWVRGASYLAGRLVGSIRLRVVFF